MVEYMPGEKEMITTLIDKYSDLQRIKNADNLEKEVEYQLKVTKAKLESFGVVTENLDID